jgi:hypothetical protein
MLSKQAIILVIMVMVWGGLLSGCSSEVRTSSRPSASGDIAERPISLTAPETSKAAAAKEIESFMVTLKHNGPTDTEVNVSLETTQGASWKAALCFDDFCYIHNGRDEMHQTLAIAAGEAKELEIKVFVPKTAGPGEAKTLKLEAAAVENLAASASLELESYIP